MENRSYSQEVLYEEGEAIEPGKELFEKLVKLLRKGKLECTLVQNNTLTVKNGPDIWVCPKYNYTFAGSDGMSDYKIFIVESPPDYDVMEGEGNEYMYDDRS